MLDQNPLYGNAALSCITEAAGNATIGRIGEIAITMHDHTSIATKLQHYLFLARLILDRPSDRGTAGKTHELDSVVDHQQFSVFVGKRQHVQSAIRPSGKLNDFRQ